MDTPGLIDRLKRADADYRRGEETMSDAEYDSLLREARVKFPNHPELYRTEARPQERDGVEVREHKGYSAPSLDKTYSNEDLPRWMQTQVDPERSIRVEPKLDGGVSMLLEFSGGVYVGSTTRGDGLRGHSGDTLLRAVRFPRRIPPLGRVVIRAEMIARVQDFQRLQRQEPTKYKSARSYVAGQQHRLTCDTTIVRAVCFEIVLHDPPSSPSRQIELLQEWGFEVPDGQVVRATDVTAEFLSRVLRQARESGLYEIDGLVLKEDCPHQTATVARNPTHSIAFKEQGEAQETRVTEVVWSVSKRQHRDGVIVKPVAKIEPVTFNGVTVRRVALHNAKSMKERGIGVDRHGQGSTVRVIRAGEIIPYIVSVSDPVEPVFPPGRMDGVEWLSQSTPQNTEDQKVEQLHGFTSKIHALQFGKKKLRSFYKLGCDTPEKLLAADPETLALAPNTTLQGARDLHVSLHSAFAAASSVALLDALDAFGPNIGARCFERILRELPDCLDQKPTLERLTTIPLIGPKKANGILEHYDTGVQRYRALLRFRGPTRPSPAPARAPHPLFRNQVVLFSGCRPTRAVRDLIERSSGRIVETFSLAVTVLLVKDLRASSSKVQKARDQQTVQILQLDQIEGC